MTNAEARFNKSHIRKVYACLAVTCHLHFWQNDRDLLRATVVTRGWNGYRNKSQPAGIRTRDLSITGESGALTTELSPPSFCFCFYTLVQRVFVECAQNLIPEKYRAGTDKALVLMVTRVNTFTQTTRLVNLSCYFMKGHGLARLYNLLPPPPPPPAFKKQCNPPAKRRISKHFFSGRASFAGEVRTPRRDWWLLTKPFANSD